MGHAWRATVLVVLAGCGRLGFDASESGPDAPISDPPLEVMISIGERPGDTSLGTMDAFLDPVAGQRDLPHGVGQGVQCDIPDVTLFRFTLPAGPPRTVKAAEFHIGVTNDRLESGVVEVREMLADWSETESTWNSQFTGVPWATPRTGGEYSAPFATFDGATLFTDYAVTVPTDVVERWWAGTSYGIAITVTATGVNFASHESTTNPELRPELVMTYVL